MGASSLKMFFLPLATHFYGKILPKIKHSMRVSTFHRPINAPNGTFSQPESTTGERRDCDARNCFAACTISDARGSSGARKRKQRFISYILCPLSVPGRWRHDLGKRRIGTGFLQIQKSCFPKRYWLLPVILMSCWVPMPSAVKTYNFPKGAIFGR